MCYKTLWSLNWDRVHSLGNKLLQAVGWVELQDPSLQLVPISRRLIFRLRMLKETIAAVEFAEKPSAPLLRLLIVCTRSNWVGIDLGCMYVVRYL